MGGFLRSVTGGGGEDVQTIVTMTQEIQGMEELSSLLFEDLHETRLSMKQVTA